MPNNRRRRPIPVVALAVAGLLAVTVITLLSGSRTAPDRVHELSQRLRCPVCKSVSIAESPSETATAMRQAVAEQVAAGRSDEQIVVFFRARYGDWVLLDPPTRGTMLPLWLAPLATAVLGAALVLAWVRRRPDAPLGELAGPARARVAGAVARARAVGSDEWDEP